MRTGKMLVLTVLAAFALFSGRLPAAPLFSDDFNDGDAAGWAPNNNTNFSWEDNRFAGTGSGSNYVYLSIHTATYADYSYSARLIRGSAPDGNFGGLVLRYQDNQNYYLFALNEAGYCWFAKNAGGAIGPLMDWTGHSFLRPDTNDVTVSCVGNKFYLYANGRFIGSCSDPDTPHPAGSVGFFVHNEMELSLDDVVIDTPAVTSTAVLPFSDTFDDGNDLGWYRHQIGGTFAVTGGRYLITGGGQGYLYGSHVDGPFGDFQYAVEVTRTAGSTTVPYGISFRGQNDSYHSSYLFAVSGAQQYTLAKTGDGSWTSIKDWTLHSGITGSTDRLKVTCNGSAITLFANGEELGSHTDATFASGTVGLFVSGDIAGSFDNVSVTALGSGIAAPPSGARCPLLTARPNPFFRTVILNGATGIAGRDVAIYGNDGAFLRMLAPGPDGLYRWDGRLADGRPAAAGLYLVSAPDGSVCRVLKRSVR